MQLDLFSSQLKFMSQNVTLQCEKLRATNVWLSMRAEDVVSVSKSKQLSSSD